MSARDASPDEMPGFPCSGRPGGELNEPLLDMIFDGRAIPPDAPQEMHDLERMLAAVAGPAEPGELAGEAAARAAFIRLASPAGVSPAAGRHAAYPVPRRRAAHRLRRRPAGRRAGLPVALCAAAAVLVSAAAAYAGVLPGPIQQVAHVTVGAPAPGHHRELPPARSGPWGDTRRGLGPAGRPAPRPAGPDGAARSPGPASIVRPRQEPPRPGPQPTLSCAPGPWPYQGPRQIASGFPPPSLQPREPRCAADPGQPARRGTMNPRWSS